MTLLVLMTVPTRLSGPDSIAAADVLNVKIQVETETPMPIPTPAMEEQKVEEDMGTLIPVSTPAPEGQYVYLSETEIYTTVGGYGWIDSSVRNLSGHFIRSFAWESTDEQIVTMDSREGKFTGRGIGEAQLIRRIVLDDGRELEGICYVHVVQPVEKISASVNELSLMVGQTVELPSVRIEPDNAGVKTYTWAVSGNGQAKIEGNMLTGLQPGTVKLTVTSDERLKRRGLQTDTVTVRITMPAESLRLEGSGTETVMNIGTKRQMKVEVEPASFEKTLLTYTSSDPGVATVDRNGQITATGSGTATISVSTEMHVGDPLVDSLTVKVVKPVQRISFPSSRVIAFRGQTVRVEPVFVPEDATDKRLSWVSDDPFVADVSDSGETIECRQVGDALLVCTTMDGTKRRAQVRLLVEPSSPVGIRSAEWKSGTLHMTVKNRMWETALQGVTLSIRGKDEKGEDSGTEISASADLKILAARVGTLDVALQSSDIREWTAMDIAIEKIQWQGGVYEVPEEERDIVRVFMK